MNKIICVAGPTASGKTALAVRLAQALNGEVISCDSMQIYRGMDIGTAKPTAEEMQGIPHYMLDVADPGESFSVGRFTQMADPILRDILAREKTAILAGGTGLYMDALISGREFALAPAPELREALERRADEEGAEALLRELREVDPDCAARLHLRDRKRIIRALEIYKATGVTMTEHDRRSRLQPPKYEARWLGLRYSDRSVLYGRIDRRVDKMLEAGLKEELQRLLAAGIPETATALQAIGYKEFLPALKAGQDLSQAAEAVKQGSRRYAKRQLTWFGRNGQIFWLDRCALPTDEDVFLAARQHLAQFDPA